MKMKVVRGASEKATKLYMNIQRRSYGAKQQSNTFIYVSNNRKTPGLGAQGCEVDLVRDPE